jgi:hypothetical protein
MFRSTLADNRIADMLRAADSSNSPESARSFWASWCVRVATLDVPHQLLELVRLSPD